uniref:Major facilitator super domain-containing protein 12 n=1 Tax=Sphaerodactylus townsendi TaxID=933632 RepID=A0ACB8F1L5_9SAUR
MWFTYLLVYFHFVLGYSSHHTGVLLLAGPVADGICTSLLVYEVDQGGGYGHPEEILGFGRRGLILSYFPHRA